MTQPTLQVAAIGILTPAGRAEITLISGKTTFIVGGNGTGKSALVHTIASALLSDVTIALTYLPGSRPSYFGGDSLTMTANDRQVYETNTRGWDSSPDTRIRPVNGTSRNERAIFDLHAAEIQYKFDALTDIEQYGKNSVAFATLLRKDSPLDRVNSMLAQAGLPVRIVIAGAELRAKRDGTTYSISKMSDGERTALILLADIVAAKLNSVILIDEPELHMHPSIVVPLVGAAIAFRTDCAFIVCTHELGLPRAFQDSAVIVVRGCTWNGERVVDWDITQLPGRTGIPEDVRQDIIGARQKILVIEGNDDSLDRPIYALLFPAVSVTCRQTCIEVRRTVDGIRSTEATHNSRAFGIVDNDGMDTAFQQELEDAGVFPLPLFSVESLYYCPEVLAAVARRQAETLGIDEAVLLNAAKTAALSSLRPENLVHLAARVAERRMRDLVLLNLPGRDQIIQGANKIEISIEQAYGNKLHELQQMVSNQNLTEIIDRYPIRETGVLDQIAKGLRFVGRQDYQRAALAVIGASDNLKDTVRTKLEHLASQLI